MSSSGVPERGVRVLGLGSQLRRRTYSWVLVHAEDRSILGRWRWSPTTSTAFAACISGVEERVGFRVWWVQGDVPARALDAVALIPVTRARRAIDEWLSPNTRRLRG